MSYKQLRHPNLQQTDLTGYCLRFTRNAFGIGSKYEYAWLNWQSSKTRHTDALPNVAVPVWFTWTGTIDGIHRNWGDVAIWVPGRGVFGTPLKGGGNSNRWDASVQARAAAIGGGAQYVGWTEDINDVKVVEPQGQVKGDSTMAKVTLEIARIVSHGVGGRNGVTNSVNALAAHADADLNKHHVGKELNAAWIRAWYNSGEGKNFRTNLAKLGSERNTFKAQVVDRDRKITDLGRAIELKDKEIERLETELAVGGDNQDTVNLNALGEALRWLVQRLGLK